MPENIEISKIDLEIEKIPDKELAKREPGVPSYKERCEYDESTIERLQKEIFKGFDKLKTQRQTDKLEEKWDMMDAQYAGEMIDDDKNLEFNLTVPATQVKVDAVERLSLKAFMESDPKFTVTPRPETAKRDQWDVIVNRQADYLDYKLDEEIIIESPLRKVLHQAVKYGVGILKVPYEYIRKLRRREENYSGKLNEQRMPEGLEPFLKAYPEAVQDNNVGNWVIKDLMAGKDVVFKAEYNDLVYDDPNPSYVNVRDFFVDRNCENYIGLCNEKLTIERQAYSWWDLKKAEANDDFINIDKAKKTTDDDGSESPEADDYKYRPYTVIECVYHFNEKDSDKIEDEKRILCWFDVVTKTYFGAYYYPYDVVESYYIPFYVKDKESGFYKSGIAEDLTQSNIAQNAILNFMLTETWQQLVTTPIIREGSVIGDQFLNKRWKPGVPLTIPVGAMSLDSELGFLEKPQTGADRLMNTLLFLGKYDDDRTGVSSLATGKESPTDPTAPAAKTAMLLKQSGINISDYINCLLPSFNRIGEVILGLTYQMSKTGRPFRQNKIQALVVGGDPFDNISRDEMIAKTNIQSRAAGFDFDKVNEKRENIALFQMMVPFLMNSPIFNTNPIGIYTLARTLVQSWSPMWKNKVDQILPSPKEIQGNMMKIVIQSLQQYGQQLAAQTKVTGVAQNPDIQQFLELTANLFKQAINPALMQEQQANA